MMFPKRKWSQPNMAGQGPEAALQKFTDDYLETNGIKYIRIPDKIFQWINLNINVIWFKVWFNKTFAGLPDNTVLLPLNDKYCVAVLVELKSAKGKLHGKQKTESRKLPWQIVRTPEELMDVIRQATAYVEKIRQLS